MNKKHYSKEELNKVIRGIDESLNDGVKRTVVIDLDAVVPLNAALKDCKTENAKSILKAAYGMWAILHKVVYVSARGENERVELEHFLKSISAPTPAVNLAGMYPTRLVLRAEGVNQFDKVEALEQYGVDIDDVVFAIIAGETNWWQLKCPCLMVV